MDFSKNTKRFLLFLSAFTVVLVLCVNHINALRIWVSGIVTSFSPFILGACLAFVFSVPMHLYEKMLRVKRRKSGAPIICEKARRPVSLVLSILSILLILVIFGLIVVPQLVDTLSSLAGKIMDFVPVAQEWLSELLIWLESYPEIHDIIAPYIPDLGQMASTLISLVQRYAGIAASTIVSQISSIFGSVTDVILSFVFALYVLLQKESLSRQGKKLIYAFLPRRFCDRTVQVARLTHRTFFSYVTIQCTEALILGALCFVGMLVFRFPYALVISVIMLFCALIPIYGAIISCVFGAFLVLIESPAQALWFVVFILVLQQLETNLIYPRVVSTSINLPSMWVLLSVTVGGGLFGVIGMLTAVPVVSVLYTLLVDAVHHRLERRSMSEEDFAPSCTPGQRTSSESGKP
ncbi:MAG: AI-2E family transporter [Clostridia bacterium]|nr:AI-2E family transporter [Clostridia bacterium]